VSLWRQITRGLRALIRRSAVDRDVSDEVQHYLDEATAAHAARGLSHHHAVRAARLELGSVASVTQQVRQDGWEHAVETFFADLRYAGRRLRTEPGFTAVTVLTIGVGVGATTAIFSAVNPILLEPLPYPQPARIAVIWEQRRDGLRNDGTFGMFRGLAGRSRSFETLAALKPWHPTLTGSDRPERLDGQRVSAGYFDVLGVHPSIGRNLEASDDRRNGPNVVVLSERLVQRRFGGDRSIVGRHITLDEVAYQVIGVMPDRFENVLAPSAELWAPLQYDMSMGGAWGHHLRTVGRLRAGVTTDRASREVNLLAQEVLAEHRPQSYGDDVQLVASRLQDDVTRGVKPALLAVLGAVVLVLAIACVNVTNLLLARGVHRRGEFALRAALGAVRSRLTRQLLTECLLLALLGGVAGIAVAILGVRALVALAPPGLPRVEAIGVDGTLFAFGFGISTLIGLAVGLLPAVHAARSDPRDHSPRTTRTHRRTRGALVVAEVALALVLLVTSGLLFRSLERLFAVTSGFDPSQLLTMQVHASGGRFAAGGAADRFFAQALEAVRRTPGVAAAAFSSQLPLSGDRDEYGAHFEASPTQRAESHSSFRYAVSPGYIEAMRIPVRRGRTFDGNDRAGAPRVALISDSLAAARFPTADPIGQRLRIGPMDGPPYTIVGVVADVRQMSLALPQSEAVYVPASQGHFTDTAVSLVVRAHGDAAALAPAVREAVWSVDRDQPIVRVATMEDLLTASAAERRFALVVLEAFAIAALVLAAAGIYGVLAGSVAERTREIGVRSALGAPRRSILALVFRQGFGLTAVGTVLGLAGAGAASHAVRAMLFGISRVDPVTYAGVIGLLAAVSLAACAVPAWRAVRVDPAATLRSE
jgi:putative ABC transport system permease protein